MVAAAGEMTMEQLAVSFDAVVRGTQSVRWHLLKQINEYAPQRSGDIPRKRIDGVTGE